MSPGQKLSAFVIALSITVFVPAHAETFRVTIDKLDFSPKDIKATVGDTIEWINNDIFAHTAMDPMRSPLCRRVNVAVVASTSSIDTTNDDAQAQLKSAIQLFDPGPVAGVVVAVDETGELSNCPQQRMAGAL